MFEIFIVHNAYYGIVNIKEVHFFCEKIGNGFTPWPMEKLQVVLNTKDKIFFDDSQISFFFH